MRNLGTKKDFIKDEVFKSGISDSNARPPPWQGDALPAELIPHW